MSEYDKTICQIREFNRFYTVHMGLLCADYLNSEYSKVETRILFEIKTHQPCIQNDIAKTLHMDKSYVSRMIQRFCTKGLVEKIKSDTDKRMTTITLTALGNAETERLIVLTNQQIASQIAGLSSDECNQLCTALHTVISMLGKEKKEYEGHTI